MGAEKFPGFTMMYKTQNVGFLSSVQHQVLFNGEPVTLRHMVEQKRLTDPGADAKATGLAYHELKETPTPADPGNFSVALVNSVYFVPGGANANAVEGGEDEGAPNPGPGFSGVLQTAAAASVVPAMWCRHISMISWAVKWSTIGIMPVRPHVTLTNDVELPPGKAVMLF